MLVISLVLVLLLAFLLFAVGLVALLATYACPAEPILIALRLHLDANTSPGNDDKSISKQELKLLEDPGHDKVLVPSNVVIPNTVSST